MSGRRPAALALLACMALGAPTQAQAGAFPLAIMVLLVHKTPGAKVRHACAAHALAVALSAAVKTVVHQIGHAHPPVWSEALTWGAGGLLLLAVQTGALRHPPALATGGATLAGLSPMVLLGQLSLATVVVLVTRLRHTLSLKGMADDDVR